MPKFSKLDPSDVQIGRGRTAFEARKKYMEAVRAGEDSLAAAYLEQAREVSPERLDIAKDLAYAYLRLNWKDAAVPDETGIKIEDAILMRARQLRNQSITN